MPTIIRHREVNIIALAHGEALAEHCRAGDIAILEDSAGWWVRFIGDDGRVDCYGDPYPSYNEALWAAKAAAEYGL